MKTKKLTIALLILAIVTTLSAGTLAVYTTRIEDAQATSVSAKTFALTLDQPVTQNVALKMAPGETVQTDDFTLSNAKGDAISEVGMDLRMNISGSKGTLDEFFKTFKGATIELLQKDAQNQYKVIGTWSEADATAIKNGGANVDLDNGLALLHDESGKLIENKQTFAFRVTWHDSTETKIIESQTNVGNKADGGSFTLYVRATQHVENADQKTTGTEA